MKRTLLCFRLLAVVGILTVGTLSAQHNPLKQGDWARVAWVSDGVYELKGSDLTSLGLGPGPWPTAQLGVYHNPTGLLPERNNALRPNGLKSLPIRVDDGGDGQFGPADVLYFYGQSPHVWNFNTAIGRYEHVQHIYSDTAFAFVTTTQGGARMGAAAAVSGAVDREQSRTVAVAFHEREQRNLVGSGRQWFGELFDYSLVHPVALDLPPLDAQSNLQFQVRAAVRTTQFGPRFVFQTNGQELASAQANPISAVAGADVAAGISLGGTYQPGVPGVPSFTVALDRAGVSGAVAHLDWVRAEADVPLVQYQKPVWVRSSSDSGKVVRYSVEQAAAGAVVWEVGHRGGRYVERPFVRVGSVLQFVVREDSARTHVVFSPNQAQVPVLRGRVENQNIRAFRGVDYLVVTHPNFRESADRLAAFHAEHSRYRTAVVEVQELYNEFSSGAQDLVAIRDFIKHLRDSAATPEDRPKYVVLFGDASYDYKNRLSSKQNFVPIYQSPASFSLYSSYCLDDFIGYLDANEGANFTSQTLDVGIGRLPVTTKAEAEAMVDKIVGYATDTTAYGPWRKRLLFVADDADASWESTFSAAQEVLANRVEADLPFFTINKIYTDAFLQQSSSGSQSYPAAREQLLRAFEQGNLVTSYLGHGGEVGWCSENLLQLGDVKAFKNGHKLPLVVTITCEFSRLDDPLRTSAGEELLLNPNGGAIALLSTTRVVGAFEGAVMNDSIFSELFKREDNRYRTLGQIVRGAKNGVKSGDKMRFTLLGDPGLRLNVPRYGAVWDSVNGEALAAGVPPSDTLKALSDVEATGYVVGDLGQYLPNYSGVAYVELLDKKVQRSTLVNDDQGVAVPFLLQENAVYRGRVRVENGRFKIKFKVPLDIALNVGPGKLTAYVFNDTSDGIGSRTDVRIGGLRANAPVDNTGPTVSAYLNDTLFQNGGYTGTDPVGLARLYDPSGINAVGNGIGHDVLGALDGAWNEAVVLNGSYESDLDRFDRGTVRLPFFDLPEGPHTFSVRAWDAYNNPAVGSVEFVVVRGQLLQLDQLFLYPNPLASGPLTVAFSHNQDGQPLEVGASLHASDGRVLRTYDWVGTPSGNRTELLDWDLNADPGGPLVPGWYWVRLRVKNTQTGQRDVVGERLVLISN